MPIASSLRYRRLVHMNLTNNAINLAQSNKLGHRIQVNVDTNAFAAFFYWFRSNLEGRPVGHFQDTDSSGNTMLDLLKDVLETPYTDFDGVTNGLHFSSSVITASADAGRLRETGTISVNDWIVAYVLYKCYGKSSYDTSDLYNVEDMYQMLLTHDVAQEIVTSLNTEEAITVAATGTSGESGYIDTMFAQHLASNPMRFFDSSGRQVYGLFEIHPDDDAFGGWYFENGDSFEIPIAMTFQKPVTMVGTPDPLSFSRDNNAEPSNTNLTKVISSNDSFRVRLQLMMNGEGNRLGGPSGLFASTSPANFSKLSIGSSLVLRFNSIFYNGSAIPSNSASNVSMVLNGGAPVSGTAGSILFIYPNFDFDGAPATNTYTLTYNGQTITGSFSLSDVVSANSLTVSDASGNVTSTLDASGVLTVKILEMNYNLAPISSTDASGISATLASTTVVGSYNEATSQFEFVFPSVPSSTSANFSVQFTYSSTSLNLSVPDTRFGSFVISPSDGVTSSYTDAYTFQVVVPSFLYNGNVVVGSNGAGGPTIRATAFEDPSGVAGSYDPSGGVWTFSFSNLSDVTDTSVPVTYTYTNGNNTATLSATTVAVTAWPSLSIPLLIPTVNVKGFYDINDTLVVSIDSLSFNGVSNAIPDNAPSLVDSIEASIPSDSYIDVSGVTGVYGPLSQSNPSMIWKFTFSGGLILPKSTIPITFTYVDATLGTLTFNFGITRDVTKDATKHFYFPTLPISIEQSSYHSVLLNAADYDASGATGPWLDESGNTRNATLTAGTNAMNAAGNGIMLDGQTYWSFPEVIVGNAWTASVWYKQTSDPSGVGASVVTGGYDTDNINLAIGYQSDSNTFSGMFYSSANGWSHGSAITVTPNTWMHICVTWDGTNMITYVNNALIGSTTPGGVAAYGMLSNYYIGKRSNEDSFIIGEVGEVRIYPLALTATSINSLYTTQYPSYPNMTVGSLSGVYLSPSSVSITLSSASIDGTAITSDLYASAVIGSTNVVGTYNAENGFTFTLTTLPDTPTTLSLHFSSGLAGITANVQPTPCDISTNILIDFNPSNYTNGETTWPVASSANPSITHATVVQGGVGAKNSDNNGIILNGSTYWSFPDVGAGNTWAAAAWYKELANPTGAYAMILTQLLNSGTLNMSLGYWGGTEQIQGAFQASSDPRSTAGYTIPDTLWHHYVLTNNGSYLSLYRDGTLVGSVSSSSVIGISSGQNYLIGASYTGDTFVNGEVGQITIYDEGLGPTIVSALYNEHVSTYPPPLLTLINAVQSTYTYPTNFNLTSMLILDSSNTPITEGLTASAFDQTDVSCTYDDKSGWSVTFNNTPYPFSTHEPIVPVVLKHNGNTLTTNVNTLVPLFLLTTDASGAPTYTTGFDASGNADASGNLTYSFPATSFYYNGSNVTTTDTITVELYEGTYMNNPVTGIYSTGNFYFTFIENTTIDVLATPTLSMLFTNTTLTSTPTVFATVIDPRYVPPPFSITPTSGDSITAQFSLTSVNANNSPLESGSSTVYLQVSLPISNFDYTGGALEEDNIRAFVSLKDAYSIVLESYMLVYQNLTNTSPFLLQVEWGAVSASVASSTAFLSVEYQYVDGSNTYSADTITSVTITPYTASEGDVFTINPSFSIQSVWYNETSILELQIIDSMFLLNGATASSSAQITVSFLDLSAVGSNNGTGLWTFTLDTTASSYNSAASLSGDQTLNFACSGAGSANTEYQFSLI
jgi:hypothetical protein